MAASFYTSLGHLLVVLSGAIVLAVVIDDIFGGLPLIFKAWLILPILATIASFYLLFRTYGVWRNALLGGVWARTRYTAVTLAALLMAWFFYYWNILGFQYLA